MGTFVRYLYALRSKEMTKRKSFDLPKHLHPEGKRAASLAANAAIRAWAADRKIGSQPATHAETSRAPIKSRKNR